MPTRETVTVLLASAVPESISVGSFVRKSVAEAPVSVVIAVIAGALGAVGSKVTAEAFVVAVTAVPGLPVTSVNVSENATAPAVSPAPIVTVAV